jgi:hypothetical protein
MRLKPVLLAIFVASGCGDSNDFYDSYDRYDPYDPYQNDISQIDFDFSRVTGRFPDGTPLGFIAYSVDSYSPTFCIAAFVEPDLIIANGKCERDRIYSESPTLVMQNRAGRMQYFTDLQVERLEDQRVTSWRADSTMEHRDFVVYRSDSLSDAKSEFAQFKVGRVLPAEFEDLKGFLTANQVFLIERSYPSRVSLNWTSSSLDFQDVLRDVDNSLRTFINEKAQEYGVPPVLAYEASKDRVVPNFVVEDVSQRPLYLEAKLSSQELDQKIVESVFFNESGILAVGSDDCYPYNDSCVISSWLPPLLNESNPVEVSDQDTGFSDWINWDQLSPYRLDLSDAPSEERPDSVGWLIKNSKRSSSDMGFCTASLLDDGRVLTAAHCVAEYPNSLYSEAASLSSSSIYFYLQIEASNRPERFRVKQIENYCFRPRRQIAHGPIIEGCDYAILSLELNPLERGFTGLRLRQEEFGIVELEKGIPAEAWIVDTVAAYAGRLKRINIGIQTDVHCDFYKIGVDHLDDRFFSSVASKFIGKEVCVLIESLDPYRRGNSGSPVLVDGEVVGVLATGVPRTGYETFISGTISWIVGLSL